MRSYNIRFEKKPNKPKVVDMEAYKKRKFIEEAMKTMQDYRHLIIIGRNDTVGENGCKGYCYSTMEPHDILWVIEQVKVSIL